jgi:hypothetical protein
MAHNPRLAPAILAMPLVAGGAMFLLFPLIAAAKPGGPVAVQPEAHIQFVVLTAVIAIAVTVFLALPLQFWLTRKRRVSGIETAMWGAVLGNTLTAVFGVIALINLVTQGSTNGLDWSGFGRLALVGTLIGALCGYAFSVILDGFRDSARGERSTPARGAADRAR